MVLVYIGAGIVLLILFLVVREKVSFYTKETCSICGEEAGHKENRRFVLADGCMCEKCAKKVLLSGGQLDGAGPKAFSSRSVDDISAEIRRRTEVGDTQWEAEKREQRAAALARIEEQKRIDSVPRCPKCGSTSISADKKGFSAGKAVVGAVLAGPVGLAAGGLGADKVQITCLNCGHHWIAGKQ